jgi:hypothetical protein
MAAGGGMNAGSKLCDAHRELLRASGIADHVIERRGYRTSVNKTEVGKLGFATTQSLHPALVIPLWNTLGDNGGYQLRPDHPRTDDDGKVIKYETPRKARLALDVHPEARGPMANPKYPLVITEGIRKADSCWSNLEVPAVALLGVSCWRGKNASGGLAALPDWHDVVLNRDVLVVFDSDLMHKPAVLHECRELGAFLARRHAQVFYVVLPDGEHGCKTGLDDFLAAGGRLKDLRALAVPELPQRINVTEEPEDDFSDLPVESGAELLDDLARFYRRFLIFGSEHLQYVLALWSLHTWCLGAFTITPRLNVSSPEKRSGKSRVIEVASCVSSRPEMVVLPSASSIFRLTEATRPTWLLDEMDNLLGASEEARAALLAIVNSGYRKGATVPRTEKVGDKFAVSRFRIFAPVAMAGLGDLPDTTADRSITIPMERKLVTERTERFHIERTFAAAAGLRRRSAAWARRNAEALANGEPDIPSQLDDRAAECWEPLLTIAELAAGDWPNRARAAAVALSGPDRKGAESLGVRLLADLRMLWRGQQWEERVRTATICVELARLDESEWRRYRDGLPIDGSGLARLLRRYDVHSKPLRVDDAGGLKGYVRSDLEPVWARYLPPVPFTGSTGSTAATEQASPTSDVAAVDPVDPTEGLEQNTRPRGRKFKL